MSQLVHYLQAPRDPDDGEWSPGSAGGDPGEGEDLPYRVEVWDEAGRFVEQVAAVSISPTIGYAAYYAAAREFPDRVVTLRHKATVISRWAGRAH